MKVESVQWVRHLAGCAIGECNGRGWSPQTVWYDAFSTVGWIYRPVPVWKADLVSYLHSMVPRFTRGVLVSNVNGAVMQDLLEERQIWTMPRSEQAARVWAVAHHFLTLLPLYVVPFTEGNAMYP
jgi:hypothetical protein